MDTTRSNTIVREVIDLDPSLKEYEAHLRALVEEMDTVRPPVPLDAAFITGLRARLMLAPRSVRSPFMNLSTWALRLAPIGAVALLLLILAPQSPSPLPTSLPDISDDPRIVDIQMGNDSSEPVQEAPSMYGYGMGGDTAEESDSSMSLKSMPMNTSSGPFVVNPQTPGISVNFDTVTVQEPSFVVIYSYTNNGREEIIGVSPLLQPGIANNLSVYLSTRTILGGIYEARIHIDNGNRLFTATEDVFAYDAYGVPMSVSIVVQ